MPDEPENEGDLTESGTATSAAALVASDTDKIPAPEPGALPLGVGMPPQTDPNQPAPGKSQEAPPGQQQPAAETRQNKGGRPLSPPSGDPEKDAYREKYRRRYHEQKKTGGFRGDTLPPRTPPPPPPPPPPPVDYEKMAGVLVNMSLNVAVMVMGQEWAPRLVKVGMPDAHGNQVLIDERAALVSCTADYLKSRQQKDIPPGMLLLMVAGSYCATRFTMPETRSRASMFVFWLKSKWPWGKKNRQAPQPPDGKKQETQVNGARAAESPKPVGVDRTY